MERDNGLPLKRRPLIYEINTWVWLNELGEKHGRHVHLGIVPPEEWDDISQPGFDAVWLMGVWERSEAGIAVSNRDEALQADFQRALADYRREDNVGSPYCVHRYAVDGHLGGAAGLASARRVISWPYGSPRISRAWSTRSATLPGSFAARTTACVGRCGAPAWATTKCLRSRPIPSIPNGGIRYSPPLKPRISGS